MRLNVEPYTAEGLDRREQARRQNVSVAEWDLPTDCEYELIGAIVHRGTAHHGSYYSYVKNRGGGAAGEGPTRYLRLCTYACARPCPVLTQRMPLLGHVWYR